jgi:hypothetical protein
MWARSNHERIDLLIGVLTNVRDGVLDEPNRTRTVNEAIRMLREMKRLPPAAPADSEIYVNFKPTAENISALSEPLRGYIHDLEARTDQAGNVREIASLQEQRHALIIKICELLAELEELRRKDG